RPDVAFGRREFHGARRGLALWLQRNRHRAATQFPGCGSCATRRKRRAHRREYGAGLKVLRAAPRRYDAAPLAAEFPLGRAELSADERRGERALHHFAV